MQIPSDPSKSVLDILDTMEGIYLAIKDTNSVFIWVNENFAKLVCIPKEELIGHKDLQKAHVAKDKEVIASGVPLLNYNETIIVPAPGGGTKAVEIVTQKGLLRKSGTNEITGITVCFSLKFPKKNADYWIEKLVLEKIELGGYFGGATGSEELFLNASLPERFSGDRKFHGENYYLLKAGAVSALHRLNQDESWFFNVGSAARLHIFSEDGRYQTVVLGDNMEKNEVLQAVAPHNHWFGVEVVDGGSFSLCSCSLSPAWDQRDSFLPTKEKVTELKTLFPDKADLIGCLATVISP